ncbi:hypothetical protein K492DRAFT_198150 [Lichtheimia hyalospora FSU 10163]|nr:hypothetical protein K492DRAFT_198150 [Lichtheimia hyalospora FSU 10163]
MSIPILNNNTTHQHHAPSSLSWMDDCCSTLSMQGSFLVINKAWEHNHHFNTCQEQQKQENDHVGMVTPPLMPSSTCISISSSMDNNNSDDNDTMINTSSSLRDSFLHVDLAETSGTTTSDSGRAQHPYARWTHEIPTGAIQPRWSFSTTALTRSLYGNNSTNNIEPYDSTLQQDDREFFQDDCWEVDDDDETVVDKDDIPEQEQFQKQVPDKPLRRPSLLSALLDSHTVVNDDSSIHLTCEENKEQQQQQQHHHHHHHHSLVPSYCTSSENHHNDALSSSLQHCVDWEQLQNTGAPFVTTTLVSQPEHMATSHSTLHYRLGPFQSWWW